MQLKEKTKDSIKIKCTRCGEYFYKSSFNRQLDDCVCSNCKKEIKFQKRKEKAPGILEKLKKENLEKRGFKPYVCESCGKEFIEDYRKNIGSVRKNPPRFCSRSCSNRRSFKDFPEDYRKNISKKLKEYHNNIDKAILTKRSNHVKISLHDYYIKSGKRLLKVCPECGKTFYTSKSTNKVYCSDNCYRKHAGGYREHSGRSKSGRYKGIYCGSTYELCWVIYNMDHNISFERCNLAIDYEYKGELHKYYPDFILEDGTLIEIKGYYQETVSIKEEAAKRLGYNIKILYKEDLEKEIKYVKDTYNTNDFASLYETGKFYEYECEICGRSFKRSHKLKHPLCSKQCQGKYSGLAKKLNYLKI